jgi:hypothetical protein
MEKSQIEQYLKNAREAERVIINAPEDRCDLMHYIQESVCGTTHCFMGWLAVDPYFQNLGLRFNKAFIPYLQYADDVGMVNAAADLFGHFWKDGLDAWEYLFAPRHGGLGDGGIFAEHGHDISDKELAIHRIEKWITLLEREQDLLSAKS